MEASDRSQPAPGRGASALTSPDKSARGSVFNIERHALHDGPGIRTLVFLKGCPLRCFWCANPEGQIRRVELMFSPAKCGGAGRCAGVCPENAISWEQGGQPVIDRETCTVCGDCVEVCPNDALDIVGDEMTARQVMEEVEKDFIFYRNSEGGVTVSGGEPMQQYEFVAELMALCREHGFTTAIETSGHAPWEHFERVTPNLDHVLIDLKHLDLEPHREATGVDPRLIQDNIRRLAASGTPMVVRIPIITGFNDSDEHMGRVAEFVLAAGVEDIHLLPYHSLGEVKYAGLFRDYPAEGLPPPTAERMRDLLQTLRDAGLTASIEV